MGTSRLADAISGNVLRIGAVLGAVVIAFGMFRFFLEHAAASNAPIPFPHTFSSVFAGLGHFDPLSITVLGLLIILATPVAQVLVSAGAFFAEKDLLYGVISLIVVAILLFSIFVVSGWLGRPSPLFVHDASLRFFFLMFGSSIIAGFVGALVGLGGGLFVVPILTLGFHVPFVMAIGASIISVIATSNGAAAVYVKTHLTNRRIGVFLEIATTIGAICGAFLSIVILHDVVLFIIFGLVLLASVVPLVFKISEEHPKDVRDTAWAKRLRFASSYPDPKTGSMRLYQVMRVRLGFAIMYVAGLLSGLLGIGSGTFKVLAMDTAMRLPMRVSVTTSNFMIGVTAAASAGIFFQRGDIDPVIVAPIALGILIGAMVGAEVLEHLSNVTLRRIFIPIVILVAFTMFARGLGWF